MTQGLTVSLVGLVRERSPRSPLVNKRPKNLDPLSGSAPMEQDPNMGSYQIGEEEYSDPDQMVLDSEWIESEKRIVR